MADVLRKLIAVLIVLRALTNLGKPFGGGFVVLGRLMHGVASTVVAPLFGLAMIFYAYGLWYARPWSLPLGVAYAAWATLNVVLFPVVEGLRPGITPVMYAVFAVLGVAGPWLAVWLLVRAARSAR